MQTTFRNLTAAWPLVVFLLLPALTRAETAVQAWVQRYNGPGNGLDEACALAVDGSNNVIVAGYSMGSGSSFDYMTVKYSSAGVPLWTNRYNGPVNAADYAFAVAVDGNNDVIVTGESNGSGSVFDYATIKYSSAGVPLWTNRYNGPANASDRPCAVAVDGNNNVIVNGSSSGGLDTGFDYATIKYSSGGETLWINRYTRVGNYGDDAAALAVDHRNDVIVTGSSFSSQSMLSSDYATVKYSSDGAPLWTNLYNGPGTAWTWPLPWRWTATTT